MIEISPKEYHIACSYEEAVLYCFQLEINGKTGWRIPTINDYLKSTDRMNLITDDDTHLFVMYIRPERTVYNQEKYHVTPVRDLTRQEQLTNFLKIAISIINIQ